jgi:hypothetical protein
VGPVETRESGRGGQKAEPGKQKPEKEKVVRTLEI